MAQTHHRDHVVMSDQPPASVELRPLLVAAERALSDAPHDGATHDGAASIVTDIRSTLARVEAATPRGASLHAQLDNVRKWLDALDDPAEHERFGGAVHLRAYVITQLRLALGALEDYQREMN